MHGSLHNFRSSVELDVSMEDCTVEEDVDALCGIFESSAANTHEPKRTQIAQMLEKSQSKPRGEDSENRVAWNENHTLDVSSCGSIISSISRRHEWTICNPDQCHSSRNKELSLPQKPGITWVRLTLDSRRAQIKTRAWTSLHASIKNLTPRYICTYGMVPLPSQTSTWPTSCSHL